MASGQGEAVRSAVSTPAPVTRTWTRAVAMTVFAVILLSWVRFAGVPSDAVQIFGWIWLSTIAWHIEAPRRQHLGFVRDWWVFLAVLIFYFFSRGLADNLGFAAHIQMPITVDTWLGGGELPSIRLQEALCGNPCDINSEPRWYDVVFTTVYFSHFVTGLSLAGVLWIRNRNEWLKWMRRYLGASLTALVVYVLYPMAPPWMAWEEGYLPHEIVRITHRGWADTGVGGGMHLVLTGVGNPVAAMPSLHAGLAFMIAVYGIQRLQSNLRWLLLLYPFLMSFTLVYYGEHYVIDILAGFLLAAVVLGACSWWEKIRGD